MSLGTPQLPLAWPPCAPSGFEGFEGHAGPLLAGVVAAGTPGRYLLSGAAGLGKTHLLMSAVHAAGSDAQYLALRGRGAEAAPLLALARDRGVIALDDIETAIADQSAAQALFHALNAWHDAGALVLLAMAQPLECSAVALPDLRSRLSQATRVALQPLDDAQRLRVLQARARARGLELDAASGEWLMRRHARDLRSLGAQLDALDRASLAAQRRLTIPFLRQVLGEGGAPHTASRQRGAPGQAPHQEER